MDAEPLVSIILPTYNRERYLREAVDSVLAQSYRRWELLVVDDGSTDGTVRYVGGLDDERVRLLRGSHCGNPAEVRNRGMDQAGGEYIAFLDSDDLWLPRKLELQVADLAAHPECGWSYTHCDRIGPEGESLPFPASRRPRSDRGWIADRLVTCEAVVVAPSVMLRRSLAQRLEGFDRSFLFFEDYEFWARCALVSPVSVVPAELVLVRDHPGSNTRGRLEVHDYWIRLAEKIGAMTEDVSLKRICRRQCARVLVLRANRQRGMGEYRQALGSLRLALRHDPWRGDWWVALAKTVLRPVTPAWLLRIYRGLRAAGASSAAT